MHPRSREQFTQRVDVATGRDTTEEGSLEQSRAASHEGIEHRIAGSRKPLDKKPGKLRLKARSVGNFMKRMRRALLRSPELVHENGHTSACNRQHEFARAALKVREASNLAKQTRRRKRSRREVQITASCCVGG